ncbi:MAG: uL30 family ribosomal protein [Candidatus Micrarchaeota archaeon]|nr:uL30 family ribosomal protein [Candidatus Micrarchaeota archaeon]MCX8154681.1 uL30 family ribosomal protein [Candidatus Micrarchaeota archaeon]
MIAIVRVRGRFGLKPKVRKTLELLRLHRPNHCVIYRDSPSLRGMLRIIENYVAYGEVSDDILKELIVKRGSKDMKDPDQILEIIKREGKIDHVFRLHPPRKGWKSIKSRYPRGALGERDDMDSLLRRMM